MIIFACVTKSEKEREIERISYNIFANARAFASALAAAETRRHSQTSSWEKKYSRPWTQWHLLRLFLFCAAHWELISSKKSNEILRQNSKATFESLQWCDKFCDSTNFRKQNKIIEENKTCSKKAKQPKNHNFKREEQRNKKMQTNLGIVFVERKWRGSRRRTHHSNLCRYFVVIQEWAMDQSHHRWNVHHWA